MKKIFKRVFVIVFAATLFALPVSIAYAATVPVLVINLPELGVKVYDYQVTEANDGVSTAIYDPTTSDQTIPVPAGKSFKLQINLRQNDSVQITIFGKTTFYKNQIYTTSSGGIIIDELPINSFDENYHIWLNAPYGDAFIYSFTTTIK